MSTDPDRPPGQASAAVKMTCNHLVDEPNLGEVLGGRRSSSDSGGARFERVDPRETVRSSIRRLQRDRRVFPLVRN